MLASRVATAFACSFGGAGETPAPAPQPDMSGLAAASSGGSPQSPVIQPAPQQQQPAPQWGTPQQDPYNRQGAYGIGG